ncbi:MAG: Coenzyme F420 hydrogenase/dehydrogenase, beta subunit C-terminal domain, partial [Intestinibacter sp.]
VDCGKCKSVCEFDDNYDKSSLLENPKVYAVKHKDDIVRAKSRSGGMFAACADYILNSKNGVVYGCGFDEKLDAVHMRIDSYEDIKPLQGSKYVQSDMGDCFRMAKKDLDDGKYVMFSGTPCQTAGFRSYVGDYSNLIVCDLICHSIPTPKLYKDYREFIESKYNSRIIRFNFRDKSRGWNTHIESYELENGEKIFSKYYTELYHMGTAIRPSCSVCKFTNTKRPSDITLGDFWGIDEVVENFDDNKGVSSVMLNTQKGVNLFEKIKNSLYFEEVSLEDAMQPRLKDSTDISIQTDRFWRDYQKYGFKYILKKYTGYGGYKTKIKRKLLKRLGRW